MRFGETARTLFSLLRRERVQPEYQPESIVGLLSRVSINGSRLDSGRIHIHVKGFADHLILRWRRGMFGALTEVVVKSKRHKQGPVQLGESEFHAYSSDEVLEKLKSSLALVRIQASNLEREWPSFDAFMSWLTEPSREKEQGNTTAEE